MNRILRTVALTLAAAGIFLSGALCGGRRAAQAQGRFGMPGTILHVVAIKWKPGVSDAEKQKVIEGVKEMAGRIPGIENIWLKADRVQPRDFDTAFAIEFKDRAAADAYAENPVHAEWAKVYLQIRQDSHSLQITNGD